MQKSRRQLLKLMAAMSFIPLVSCNNNQSANGLNQVLKKIDTKQFKTLVILSKLDQQFGLKEVAFNDLAELLIAWKPDQRNPDLNAFILNQITDDFKQNDVLRSRGLMFSVTEVKLYNLMKSNNIILVK